MGNIFSFCLRYEDGTSEVINANVFASIDTWPIFSDQHIISYLENWNNKRIHGVCQNPLENIGRSCEVHIIIHTDNDEVELIITDKKTGKKLLCETGKSHGEKVERLGDKVSIILPQSDDYAR